MIEIINKIKSSASNNLFSQLKQIIKLGEEFIIKICKIKNIQCVEDLANNKPIYEELNKLFKIIFEKNNFQKNFSFLYTLWIKGLKDIYFLENNQKLNRRFKRNAGNSENIFKKELKRNEIEEVIWEVDEENIEEEVNEEEVNEVNVLRRVYYNQWAVDNFFISKYILVFIILLAILIEYAS
ncbi:hypothetical protein ACQ4LE_006141 [Meloidogyne hapla]